MPNGNIAAEVTLRGVEQFQLKVETIHYNLMLVFFHGEYEGHLHRARRSDEPDVPAPSRQNRQSRQAGRPIGAGHQPAA